MLYGADKSGWGAERRQALEREISKYGVVEYNIGIVREYAAIRVETERAGTFPGERDVWIAAMRDRSAGR